MKKNLLRHITALLICFITPLIAIPVFSLSAAAKSNADYLFLLSQLRSMQIMVSNFPDDMIPDAEGKEKAEGNEIIKKMYDDIRQKFQRAGETYYSRNYVDAYNQFRSVKLQMIELLELLSRNYMHRTKSLLDSTSKQSFDILVEYTGRASLAAYFRKPFDPLYDEKPYNEKNYHLFHDRERIEAYLKDGYRKYQDAQNLHNDPEIEIIRNKRNLPSKGLNYIIQRYIGSILLCRESKQLGIEIYKIGITIHEIEDRPRKPERPITYGQAVEPILDDRIPDKYKIDANDNQRLIHSIEKRKLTR